MLAALLGLGACGAPAPSSRARTPALLDRVADVRQTTDYTCGPAALQAVLAYYAIDVDEMTLARAARTDPAVGAALEALARVARSYGLVAEIRERLTIEDLRREVEAGRPVIVLNQSWRTDPAVEWGDAWDDGHYLVVIGTDDRYVYVEDPSLIGARGAIPTAEFLERWHCWSDEDEKAWGQGILFSAPPGGRRGPPRGVVRIEMVE